ncbi:MAG TPA: hypothetical protein VJ953_20015, partial [Saprospiraceae bacterium]|nr:hypothetical protein [Saprospiraceae bacterium]
GAPEAHGYFMYSVCSAVTVFGTKQELRTSLFGRSSYLLHQLQLCVVFKAEKIRIKPFIGIVVAFISLFGKVPLAKLSCCRKND